MTAKLFDVDSGFLRTWSVNSVASDEAAMLLTVRAEFKPGTRFAFSSVARNAPRFSSHLLDA